MQLLRFGRSASLRTRVALASAAAAAAVVAVFTVLTSIVLANNDAEQLDRRLNSIIEASMLPSDAQDPSHTVRVLTTGRSASSGQVVFQRGFQLPRLPEGTDTVTVNGIDYRVRTVQVDQQGGVLMSVGIRADSILLTRARIPLYSAVGVLTVLIAWGLGWLLAGPAVRPLRRLTEQTMRLGKGGERMEAVTGAREAEELSVAMADMLNRLTAAQQATTNSLAGGAGLRGERGARVAHAADGDASRPRHLADPRPAHRGARRGGRSTCCDRSAASRRSSPRWGSWRRVSWRRPRTAS